ncbi:MAG TPA: hypothetical protein VLF15_07540 [Pseudoxanthomonas sp.]|nr:hypothetical protein [Pseudoxanthomonas sp.]
MEPALHWRMERLPDGVHRGAKISGQAVIIERLRVAGFFAAEAGGLEPLRRWSAWGWRRRAATL